jgi:MraW methylase family
VLQKSAASSFPAIKKEPSLLLCGWSMILVRAYSSTAVLWRNGNRISPLCHSVFAGQISTSGSSSSMHLHLSFVAGVSSCSTTAAAVAWQQHNGRAGSFTTQLRPQRRRRAITPYPPRIGFVTQKASCLLQTSTTRLFGSAAKGNIVPKSNHENEEGEDDNDDESANAVVTMYTAVASTSTENMGDGGISKAPFAIPYHAPVMWNECVANLLDCERGRLRRQQKNEVGNEDDQEVRNTPLLFVDGTLGGGGHSQALLQALQPGDVLFGCDVDATALQVASERLAIYTDQSESQNDNSDSNRTKHPLFVPVQSNFGDLTSRLLAETLAKASPDHSLLHAIKDSDDHECALLRADGILLSVGLPS